MRMTWLTPHAWPPQVTSPGVCGTIVHMQLEPDHGRRQPQHTLQQQCSHPGGTSEIIRMQSSPPPCRSIPERDPNTRNAPFAAVWNVTALASVPPVNGGLHISRQNPLSLSAFQSPTRSSQGLGCQAPNHQTGRHRHYKNNLQASNSYGDHPGEGSNISLYGKTCRNLTAALNHASADTTLNHSEYGHVPSHQSRSAGGTRTASAQFCQERHISPFHTNLQGFSTHSNFLSTQLTCSTIHSSATASMLCPVPDHMSELTSSQSAPPRPFPQRSQQHSDPFQMFKDPALTAPGSAVPSSMGSASPCNSISDDIVGIARQQGASLVDMCERMVASWKTRAMQAETAKQAAQVQVWVNESKARGLKQQLDVSQQALGVAQQAEQAATMALTSIEGGHISCQNLNAGCSHINNLQDVLNPTRE